MALRIEDGSGVARANSAVATTDADDWAAERGHAAWDALTAAQKELALIKAADYLRNEQRFCYRGTRKTLDQGLPFPRSGCTLHRGPAVPDDTVPQMFKDAQMALAMIASGGTELQPDLARGGRVKSETVSVISTTYMDDAPAETLYAEAMGYLTPLLRTGFVADIGAFFYQASTPEGFTPGEFDNPPTA